jgi:hypothetical protein
LSVKLDGKEVPAMVPTSEFAGKKHALLEVTYV